MLKKTAFLVCCLTLVWAAKAQEKFGHVNSQEILMTMPERVTIEKELDELQTQWENEMLKMREEYLAKIKEFQDKQATMPESIKQARQSEIMDLEQRISTFSQTASSDLQQKQQELLTPVIEKIRAAIDEVGKENDLIYIFDTATQSIIYSSPKANDVTQQVKKKLGIQ